MSLFTNWVDLDHYEVVMEFRIAEAVGRPPEEHLGWSLVAVIPHAKPEDAAAHLCIYARHRQVEPLRAAGVQALSWVAERAHDMERDLRGYLQSGAEAADENHRAAMSRVHELLRELEGPEAFAMLDRL